MPAKATGEQHPLLFAPEIEASLVSMCWHEPERVALVYRQLDPAIHLVQPHLRLVLEAINIAYGQLGSADWASVVQVVREGGQFEECGGLEGLNALYDLRAYGRDQARDEVIFSDYLQMLKHYARNRAQEPPRKADYFTGGHLDFYLHKANDPAKEPGLGNPDLIGEGKVAGKIYLGSAWTERDAKGQKFLKIRLMPK
jgi:hypothetical protein